MSILQPSGSKETSNIPSKGAAILAALLAIGPITGCVRESVAHSGGVTVIDNGTGNPQVICQPSYTSGTNAKK